MTEVYTIASPLLTAVISDLGAELQSLTSASGLELLHDGQSFWSGRAPVLFPIVGALKDDTHVLDGVSYHLPKHGFARKKTLRVVSHSADEIVFGLEADAATRAAYPYEFALSMAFKMEGTKLSMIGTVRNTDDKPIPVSFGFHPAFRWPLEAGLAKTDYQLTFPHEEPSDIEQIDGRGLVVKTLPTPIIGRTLALDDSLFADDALIFLEHQSRVLHFGPKEGSSPALNVTYPDMPHLGVWMKPGAPYLCIEPWQGYASPVDFSGSLMDKPGTVVLGVGESRTFTMTAELV